MNMTSRPFAPRTSSRRRVFPVTTSGRAKSGAVLPNSSAMVDSVSAISSPNSDHWFDGESPGWVSITRLTIESSGLEQPLLPSGQGQSKMLISEPRRHAPARGSIKETDLDQKRLIDFLESILFFGQSRGQGAEADGSAVVLLDD